MLFIDYARTWLDVYKAQSSANTRAMYRGIIETHFRAISGVKLCEVDRLHVQIVLNAASGKIRTQEQILLTVRQVLKSAAADKLLPPAAVAEILQALPRVKYTAPEKRALTEYEKKAVFDAVYKYGQDKIYILYGCGLRREEAAALTVFDFNFPANTVTVNKAYEWTQNTPTQKEPKTRHGYRTIPIPSKILPDVRAYVNALKRRGGVLLFTTAAGDPLTKTAYLKMWGRITAAMQEVSPLPIIGLTGHMFRHNYCTNLCYQIPQISIKHIAQLMGDTEAVVLKIYNHILTEKEDAAKAVNDAMNF